MIQGKASKSDREDMLLLAQVIQDKADFLVRGCRTYEMICKDTRNSWNYIDSLENLLETLDTISEYTNDLYNKIEETLNG